MLIMESMIPKRHQVRSITSLHAEACTACMQSVICETLTRSDVFHGDSELNFTNLTISGHAINAAIIIPVYSYAAAACACM